MDRLKLDVTAMLNAGIPADADLQSTISAYTASLEQDVASAPQRIKEIVNEVLSEGLGWDFRRKAVKVPAKFIPANFPIAFDSLLDTLNNWSPVKTPTADELQDISKACNRLWELDVHRLVPGKDYIINVQKGKSMSDTSDAAKDPLFTFVDDKVFNDYPTYTAFIALLDNYVASLGASEVVTQEELNENQRFLNLIMDTGVMQYLHQYLLAKGHTKATTRADFISELNQLWFGLYKRKVANDSSGFEHVFVGEIKEEDGEITGFHNWIQLYLEEKKGNFDYRGYIKPKRSSYFTAGANEQFISLQFVWKGALKNVSSSFIGTSPEFEFALYTLCFYSGQEKMIVQCGPYRVEMTCYRWNVRDKVYIASSFPSDAPLDATENASKGSKSSKAK